MQPSTDPGSVLIESWPDVAAFEPLNGEPAMTLNPDLRVSGVVTILTSLALRWWAVRTGRGDATEGCSASRCC